MLDRKPHRTMNSAKDRYHYPSIVIPGKLNQLTG
jgi:hypothetical protein